MTENKEIERIIVPVSDALNARSVVDHVYDDIRESKPDVTEIFFIYPIPILEESQTPRTAHRTLELIEFWAEQEESEIEIHTEILRTDEYLFGTDDYADLINDYCTENNVDTVILPQEFRIKTTQPVITALQSEMESRGLSVEILQTRRAAGHIQIFTRGGIRRFGFVFVASLAFYLAIGSPSLFNIATGIPTAFVTSIVLYKLAFQYAPHVGRISSIGIRWLLYIPYLLWEIFRANVQITYIVLHPSLPINPGLHKFQPALLGAFPVTTLANSITLTPGTLTVDERDGYLFIHTLTKDSEESILDGKLERAVRFIMYGRKGMKTPTPRDRDQYEILSGENDD